VVNVAITQAKEKRAKSNRELRKPNREGTRMDANEKRIACVNLACKLPAFSASVCGSSFYLRPSAAKILSSRPFAVQFFVLSL
jgi:hypothetical protein